MVEMWTDHGKHTAVLFSNTEAYIIDRENIKLIRMSEDQIEQYYNQVLVGNLKIYGSINAQKRIKPSRVKKGQHDLFGDRVK